MTRDPFDRRFHPAPFGFRNAPVRPAATPRTPRQGSRFTEAAPPYQRDTGRANGPPSRPDNRPDNRPEQTAGPRDTGRAPRRPDIKFEDFASADSQRPTGEMGAELTRLRELVEEKDQHAREAAVRARQAEEELERAKKRIRKESLKELERRRRDMLLSFLEVLDDLDRAREAAAESEPDSAVTQGVELVRKGFLDRLARYDVVHVPSLGQPFDPMRHEAMSMVPTDDCDKDGIVVGVIREGYAIGDQTLRPASVAVGKRIATDNDS